VISKRRSFVVTGVSVSLLMVLSAVVLIASSAFGTGKPGAISAAAINDETWHSANFTADTLSAWDSQASKDLAHGNGGRLAELNVHRAAGVPSEVMVSNDSSYVAVIVFVQSNIVSDADNDTVVTDDSGTALMSISPYTKYSTIAALYQLSTSTQVDPDSAVLAGDYAMLVTDGVDEGGTTDSGLTRFDYVDGVLDTWGTVDLDGPWADTDSCSSAPYMALLAAKRHLLECDLLADANANSDATAEEVQLRSVSCASSSAAAALFNQIAAQSCSVPGQSSGG
jgi:hypothetical protein